MLGNAETKDFISEIFGYVLIGVAFGLGVWQYNVSRAAAKGSWLNSRRRLHRRIMISVILVLIGTIMVLEAHKYIPTYRPAGLLIYLFSTVTLSLVLLLLAAADVYETANSAMKQSLSELDEAIRCEKLKAEAEKDSGSEEVTPQ
jgi:heme/copper-type cytochrome/quinol oxidase subunit 3